MTETLKQKALSILTSKLGQKETGRNTGPSVEWAMAHFSKVKPDKSGWAEWCAASVCTSYLEAGSKQMEEVGTTAVPTLFRRLDAKRQIYYTPPSSRIPEPGDLVFFRNHLGTFYHVGLVESYSFDPKAKIHTLTTIEGNSNDKVERSTYTYNEVFSHSRPWYAFGTIGE